MTTQNVGAGTENDEGHLEVVVIDDQKLVEEIKAVAGDVVYLIGFKTSGKPVLIDVNGLSWDHEIDPDVSGYTRFDDFEAYVYNGNVSVRGCTSNAGRKCCQRAAIDAT